MITLSDVKATLADGNWAPLFRNQVFFTLINGVGAPACGVIPPENSRELISGQTYVLLCLFCHHVDHPNILNRYFIRSRVDPTEFWNISSSGLGVSKTSKTPFEIRRVEDNTNGSIMILSDEILVYSAESGDPVAVEYRHPDSFKPKIIKMGQSMSGDEIMQVRLEMFFGGGFLASRVQFSEITIREVGKGEVWELV